MAASEFQGTSLLQYSIELTNYRHLTGSDSCILWIEQALLCGTMLYLIELGYPC